LVTTDAAIFVCSEIEALEGLGSGSKKSAKRLAKNKDSTKGCPADAKPLAKNTRLWRVLHL